MLVKIVGRIEGDLTKISGLTTAVKDEEIAVIRSEAHLMEAEEKTEIKKKNEQKR